LAAPQILTLAEASRLIEDGWTVGVGGAIDVGHPFALVREIIAAGPRHLEIVAGFGGLDIDMIAASGCARAIIAAFIGSEIIPARIPGVQRALELGLIDVMQIDEGILLAAMRASAQQVPFTTWTGGMGTSATDNRLCTEELDSKTGQHFIRVEPLYLDACLVWAEAADEQGNLLLWGPDFGDPAMLAASRLRIAQVDRIVSTREIARHPDRVLPWSADVVTPTKSGTFPFGGAALDPDARWLGRYAAHMRQYAPVSDPDELRSAVWQVLQIPGEFDKFQRSTTTDARGKDADA
jgi:glutaconate CoA-transferase, subunit A